MKPSLPPILRAFVFRLVYYVFSVAVYQATCHLVDRLHSLPSSTSGYFSPSSPTSTWELSIAFGVGLLFTLLMTGLFHFVASRFASGKTPKCPSCVTSCRSRGRARSRSPSQREGRYVARLVRSGSARDHPICSQCRLATPATESASAALSGINQAGPSSFNPLVGS